MNHRPAGHATAVGTRCIPQTTNADARNLLYDMKTDSGNVTIRRRGMQLGRSRKSEPCAARCGARTVTNRVRHKRQTLAFDLAESDAAASSVIKNAATYSSPIFCFRL